MRYVKLANLFVVLVLAIAAVVPVLAQQTDPPQYFPETGHEVRFPFISYFNRAGGLSQHGYPITDDFVDPKTGLLVQYFEKSRLEWHPGNPEPYKVQLGLLGDELGKREPPIPISQIPAANDPNCMHFFETGHNMCLIFKDYWLQHGALDRFGYPIGEYTIENDRVVQYYQRARMEWQPGKPAGQKVQLGPLGRLQFDISGLPDSLGWPNIIIARDDPGAVTSLEARGSVVDSVAVAGGTQSAFVYVTDQLGVAIGGAGVTLIVHYPDHDDDYTLPPTSSAGVTVTSFTVPKVEPGALVSMEFIITYAGVFAETRTSYMVWY